MEPALILLGVLVAVGVVLYIHDRLTRKHGDEPSPRDEQSQGCADTSCLLRETCPSEQLLANACSEKPVYYDDEELDQFKDRQAQDYTPEETDQFREVLYTLRHDEILAWHHSLGKRGIALPETLRDELLMLASEPSAPSQPPQNDTTDGMA